MRLPAGKYKWETVWIQKCLINETKSLERITFQWWGDTSKGRHGTAERHLWVKINSLINHCVLLCLRGFRYLFSPPTEDRNRSGGLHLSHIICHQSFTPRTISAWVFHPLSLSSAINLSLRFCLTAVINSVKQLLLHLHYRAEANTHTHIQYTQAEVFTLPVLGFVHGWLGFLSGVPLDKSALNKPLSLQLNALVQGIGEAVSVDHILTTKLLMDFHRGILANGASRWSPKIVFPPIVFISHKMLHPALKTWFFIH